MTEARPAEGMPEKAGGKDTGEGTDSGQGAGRGERAVVLRRETRIELPQQLAGVGEGGGGDELATEKAGDFANAGFAVEKTDRRYHPAGRVFTLADHIVGAALCSYLREMGNGEHLHMLSHSANHTSHLVSHAA